MACLCLACLDQRSGKRRSAGPLHAEAMEKGSGRQRTACAVYLLCLVMEGILCFAAAWIVFFLARFSLAFRLHSLVGDRQRLPQFPVCLV